MANRQRVVFGLLILHLYVNAAPSDVSKQEDPAEVDETNIRLDSEPYEITQEKEANDDTTQSTRQKRYFNNYGYGLPPIGSFLYSNIGKRDQSSDTGVYGAEDSLIQIHRKLQEIAELTRQQVPQPVPSPVPIFFPIIYNIPQIGCGCFPETTENAAPKPTVPKNQTKPDLDTRFKGDKDDEEEFSRPISFVPIKPNRSIVRPAPPVEHGSFQASAQSDESPQSSSITTTTTTTTTEPSKLNPSLSIATDSRFPEEPIRPTDCDGAILKCCHQQQVTYDCFSTLGCPDTTSYGNPCDVKAILQVINRYQNFYGQKSW